MFQEWDATNNVSITIYYYSSLIRLFNLYTNTFHYAVLFIDTLAMLDTIKAHVVIGNS